MAIGVGHHAEIPDVLRPLWKKTSAKYAGLMPIDEYVLWLLIDDVWQNKNGLLELSVKTAAEHSVSSGVRSSSLKRLIRAGVILKIAEQEGSNAERYAVHFWPLSTKPELLPIAPIFREWANRERAKYKHDFSGDIPENYQLIPEPEDSGYV